jgi:hypothetical protein
MEFLEILRMHFSQLKSLSLTIAMPYSINTQAKADKFAADYEDALLSSRQRSYLSRENFSIPRKTLVEPPELQWFTKFVIWFPIPLAKLHD